jgi:hypothetical protein
MSKFKTIFGESKAVIGMIHVPALPGTPAYKGSVKEIIKKSVEEAKIYKENGISALMIENMHDTPYLNRKIGHEISTLTAIIAYEIKNLTQFPVGIQILAGANSAALASAHSAGVDFIRAEGFVFAHVADEGMMNSDAGKLLRYRKQIGAENILIFTDIKKKHSAHTITNDVDIVKTAEAAEFFQSDGLIITGESTGKPADLKEIADVKKNVKISVLVGSGISAENISEYIEIADGLIIGSYFKKEGFWKNELDENRIKQIINKL